MAIAKSKRVIVFHGEGRSESSRFGLGVTRTLFDKFSSAASRPGIISQAKLNAVANAGVFKKQEHVQRVGIRISEVDLAHRLKGLRRNLARIGREAVRNFQSELIGLMLGVTAVGAENRVARELKHGEQ